MPTYLEDLTLRLATGIAQLPEPVRQRHARYLLAAQREDGGFAGREGGSDLYYTGFALRSLAMLGELYGPPAEKAAAFLNRSSRGRSRSSIFCRSCTERSCFRMPPHRHFVGADPNWRDSVAAALSKLRRPDGGYAKGAEGAASSTYHTFLVLLCLQLIERRPEGPGEIATFLKSQHCDDGGFREIRASKRAGTNPTAAAIGALRILDNVDEKHANGTSSNSWPRCKPTKGACGRIRGFRSPTS
jgi:geranylgeranyl transferase type-2 subunit beta